MGMTLLFLRIRIAYWLIGDLFKVVPASAQIVLEGEHYHRNPKKRKKELPLIKEDEIEEERYDCPIHGLQDGADCPRC